jgi:hypothetical protein
MTRTVSASSSTRIAIDRMEASSSSYRLTPHRRGPASRRHARSQLHRQDQPDVRRRALSTRFFSLTRP